MSLVLLPARLICHLARQQDWTQRNHLENTFPKDSTFLLLWFFLTVNLYYAASIYVMYLCSIFFKAFATQTIQIKGLMQFGLYNPEHLHAFRIIKSAHSVTFWPVTFNQRLGRLVVFECIFWWFWMWNTFYLTVLKTYDWFKAIKRFGSSPICFILLHLLSYIFFKKN